jgi:hypothetical protein
MNPDNILPRRSSDPLRFLYSGETWLEWACELYAHTLFELELSPDAWVACFGTSHPGPGYTRTLEAQRTRLRWEIGQTDPLMGPE